MDYALTEHARRMLVERDVPLEWLERILTEPALRDVDPADATLERLYLPIPEREGRVLRVVLNTSVVPARVVSVFFDRRMRDKL